MKFNSGYFQFAFQEEKDVAATNPLYYLRLLSGTSVGPDREIQTKRTAEGTRAADGISVIGTMGSGGTVNFVCQNSNLPAILYGAMGAIDTTGAGDPYTHVVSPEQTGSIPWITGWLKIDTIRMCIPNLRISTLKLVVSSADRLVVGQMELMGAGAVQYKTAEPGVPATAEPVAEIFSWNMAKGAWDLDGDTIGYIHTFEWNVNNNLTGIPGEDFFFYDIQEGPLDLDYAAVITIIEASQYNELVWGTASPSNNAEPAAAIQTGSFNTKFTAEDVGGKDRTFEIDVTESEYRNPLPKLAIDPDGKPQDLRLEARCTGADPKAELTCLNGTASYAVGS